MGTDLHWFPEDVSVSRLAAVLVGMANLEGGTVILGISPRSGQVMGVTDVEGAIDRVFQATLLTDPPLVLPIPRVQSLVEPPKTRVIWISVPPGLPNVYSLEGSYLGREGRQTNPLSARRLRQLLMERGAIQFESQVPPGASLVDLDPVKVEAYAQALYLLGGGDSSLSPAHELLLRRGCLSQVGKQLCPTYAALLLFGRHPQRWLPNSTILAARFSGVAFSDRFIKQDISGTLPDQLRQVESFLQDNLRRMERIVGFTRQETFEYPLEAARELLVNAVAHRDYSLQGDNIHLNIFMNRMEVSSPGGLPGPVTLDNLLKARFSRNAVIVQVLADMGFVERLWYGLDRVVTVLRQHGLQSAHFEESAASFQVTLFAPDENQADIQRMGDILSTYRSIDLNSRQQMAIQHLARYRRITNSTFQDLCPDVHPETLRRDLVDLVSKGILLKIGDKRATYYILK